MKLLLSKEEDEAKASSDHCRGLMIALVKSGKRRIRWAQLLEKSPNLDFHVDSTKTQTFPMFDSLLILRERRYLYAF
jgi:hypothetical protein